MNESVMANRSAFPADRAALAPSETGFTKRELIAAMAMQGYCANTTAWDETDHVIATWAVSLADKLLAELSK